MWGGAGGGAAGGGGGGGGRGRGGGRGPPPPPEDEPGLCGAAGDGRRDVQGAGGVYVDPDVGVCGSQRRERVRDMSRQQALDGGHDDVSADGVPVGVELGAQVRGAPLGVEREGQDAVPGGGQGHPAGAAGEQAHAKIVFQELDLPADRAGRHEEAATGAGHGAGGGDLAEVMQPC